MDEFLSLKRMLVMSWVYLGVLVLGSWLLGSGVFAWSVAAGGLISVASFWVSFRDVTAFVESLPADDVTGSPDKPKKKTSKKAIIFKFWLRIALIGVMLFLLIRYGNINIFGLILGLTTVVFTITMSGIGVVWRYYFSRR